MRKLRHDVLWLLMWLVATTASGQPSPDGHWVGFDDLPIFGHSQVYDGREHRILIFGGIGGAEYFSNEIWAMDTYPLADWHRLEPQGEGPSGRYQHLAIFDPVGNRMLVYGGFTHITEPIQDGLWALNLSDPPTWERLQALGSEPPPFAYSGAFYDPVHAAMVVVNEPYLPGEQVWKLDLTGTPTWSAYPEPATLPNIRLGQAPAYDALRQRVYFFGGHQLRYPEAGTSELWTFDPATGEWLQLETLGLLPAARRSHSLVFDLLGDRLLLFGGATSYLTSGTRNDLWELSLATNTWHQIFGASPSPTPRALHTAIYDLLNDKMIVQGGWITSRAETWFYGDDWSVHRSGDHPGLRRGLALGWDVVSDAPILFGGVDENRRLGDVWTRTSPFGWKELSPGLLAGREGPSLLYDAVRDRWIVHAGRIYSSGGSEAETWELQLRPTPKWSRILRNGPDPEAGEGHGVALDSFRDQMLVVGRAGEIWALPLGSDASWISMAIAPDGFSLVGRAIHYDSALDRILAVAQVSNNPDELQLMKFSLDGGTDWEGISDPFEAPTYEFDGVAGIYDGSEERFVILGRTTLWECLADGGAWREMQPSGIQTMGRIGHAAAYDAIGDKMIVYGGYSVGSNVTHRELRWNSPSPIAPISAEATLSADGVALTWRSLASDKPFRTVIRYSRVDFPHSITDGREITDLRQVAFEADQHYVLQSVQHAGLSEGSAHFYSLFNVDEDGGASAPLRAKVETTGNSVDQNVGGDRLLLEPASPNPSNPMTSIRFTLPVPQSVTLRIFDLRGQLVRSLVSHEALAAGLHERSWDGVDADGTAVASGVYVYQLDAGGVRVSRKLVLVR